MKEIEKKKVGLKMFVGAVFVVSCRAVLVVAICPLHPLVYAHGAVNTRHKQQEPVTRVEPGETECTAATHERAAVHHVTGNHCRLWLKSALAGRRSGVYACGVLSLYYGCRQGTSSPAAIPSAVSARFPRASTNAEWGMKSALRAFRNSLNDRLGRPATSQIIASSLEALRGSLHCYCRHSSSQIVFVLPESWETGSFDIVIWYIFLTVCSSCERVSFRAPPESSRRLPSLSETSRSLPVVQPHRSHLKYIGRKSGRGVIDSPASPCAEDSGALPVVEFATKVGHASQPVVRKAEIQDENISEGSRRTEYSGALTHAEESEYPRENPPTSGIVWHDSHMRKLGMTRPGIETGSPWWEASRLIAQPPCPIYILWNSRRADLAARDCASTGNPLSLTKAAITVLRKSRLKPRPQSSAALPTVSHVFNGSSPVDRPRQENWRRSYERENFAVRRSWNCFAGVISTTPRASARYCFTPRTLEISNSVLRLPILRTGSFSTARFYPSEHFVLHLSPDLPWRSRLVRRRTGVREALGSSPGREYRRLPLSVSYARLHHRGSKLDRRSHRECSIIRVQNWTEDRDEVRFEPPKLSVPKLHPRSAAIVEKCSLTAYNGIHMTIGRPLKLYDDKGEGAFGPCKKVASKAALAAGVSQFAGISLKELGMKVVARISRQESAGKSQSARVSGQE
ncbi:hypothetical protein PR048_019102 [Dryococelus australis]|uniref:Uncharacterized protein n=1 Tax=Dryococelus australis TaxID=614101 RepID=A0ABQ9H2K8_9NEOP|nr:hypothetical protein PR048_019102 [Dryococelus australis]